ncbi:MAG: hypothetical protein M9934_01730 [Thermomicrobiales bacterium]|nr:hypothetical protein [Thermomicrobiales bacterium]
MPVINRIWELPEFTDLVDHHQDVIGRVVSSEKEPAGSHQFHFWGADDALALDIGHIVVTFSEEAAVIGVVDEPRRFSDMHSFLDDYFDRRMEIALPEDGPTQRPEILVFTVNVLATKHLRRDVQSNRPAINGPVYFATEAAINYALGVEHFDGSPIPALMHTNGNYVRDAEGNILLDVNGHKKFQKTPLYLDENYLLGPEAGHANWTGQSGLATKTSHALFLTSSIFQTLQRSDTSVAALMFNVKGPDLLWLDKPAVPVPGMEALYDSAGARGLDDDQLNAYTSLRLEPTPFDNFNIFAPFKPGQEPQSYSGKVDLAGFSDQQMLNTHRNMSGQNDRVFPILWSLDRLLAYPHRIFDHNDLDDKLFGFIYELREMGIKSIDQLNKQFEKINQYFETPDENGRTSDTWNGHHKATIRKAQNRFKGLQDKFAGLIANGAVDYGTTPMVDYAFTPQELRVVDISACNTNVQELIVTSTINAIWRLAEKSDMGVDKLIVFVDELNKYAPAGGEGGLRDTLVDIAARGRHLNVVLLGAQQFRSKVDGEILGNCGTSFYGRIGDEEIINAAYRSISETQKQELLGLSKGRMLVRHAHYRSPLFGTFPYPPSIPGIFGQRVFGGEDGPAGDPVDGLMALLDKYMGDNAPRKGEVQAHADGLDREDIERVRSKLSNVLNGNTNRRSNPWEMMKRELANSKEAKRFT